MGDGSWVQHLEGLTDDEKAFYDALFEMLGFERLPWMGLLVVAACIGGLALTHVLHAKVADLRTRADQLQASYSAFAEENKRLVATEAQLASRTQVVMLATKKVKLYEPGQGQVRRM